MSLIKIENEIQNCKSCPGLTKLQFNSISYGKNNDILFIGESPALKGWITTGKPFHNINDKLLPTGRILNELLSILNLTIDDITFTEVCKCYVPERQLLEKYSNNCLHFLEKQIYLLNPKLIITLGYYPAKLLINEKLKKLGDIAGQTFKIKILDKDVKIIPIYHPSPINPKSYQNNIPIFKAIKKELILN